MNLNKETKAVFSRVATYGYREFTFYWSNSLQNYSPFFVVVHDSSNQFEDCFWLVVLINQMGFINTQLLVLNYRSILNKSRSVLTLCYYHVPTRWMWRVIELVFSENSSDTCFVSCLQSLDCIITVIPNQERMSRIK